MLRRLGCCARRASPLLPGAPAAPPHPMMPCADLPYANAKPTDHQHMAASMTSTRFFSNTFFARPLPISSATKPICMKKTRYLRAARARRRLMWAPPGTLA